MISKSLRAGFSAMQGFGLNAFTVEQLDIIHAATLRVLRDTGIRVESEKALEIFHSAGAVVKRLDKGGIVKLPSHLVEDCIRWTPRGCVFYGRRPEDDYPADGTCVGFTAGFGEHVRIIDPDTREVRPTVKQDLADITRIQDYLETCVVVERAACSGDKPPATQPLHNYAAMVQNTSKHCFLGFGSAENTRKIIRMAEIAAGGAERFKARPTVTGFVCPSSPLSLVTECTDAVMACAEGGIGIAIIPMSLSGASSPATLGGVVVQHNAEVLSALILAQLVRRGTPCVYCGCSTIMDLRFGVSPVGVPEMALLSVAWAKLAQYYHLPDWVGACASDSKLPDAQQAYDFSLTAMPAALAGANIIYGLGAIESLLTFDYAAMISGAEQARRILRVLGGIEISDDSMALDLIHEIGPGGEYMTHPHTFQHMRGMSRSELFYRKNRESWLAAAGGQDLAERAYAEAGRILAEHTPLPLPDGAAKAIDQIIEDREMELDTAGRRSKG